MRLWLMLLLTGGKSDGDMLVHFRKPKPAFDETGIVPIGLFIAAVIIGLLMFLNGCVELVTAPILMYDELQTSPMLSCNP